MQSGLIIIFVLVPVVLLIWQIARSKRKICLQETTRKEALVPTVITMEESISDSVKLVVDVWWEKLDDLNQLYLAIILAEKALPVWQKYISTQEAIYRDGLAKPYIKIDGRMLKAALDEMNAASKKSMPPADHKGLTQCYINFIGPVVALQDANWLPPYPVKKIFLAVYYMLKQVIEKNNTTVPKNLLSLSINQSIDCMDMSRLYTKEEILLVLALFKTGV
jgi:hypothetical protein